MHVYTHTCVYVCVCICITHTKPGTIRSYSRKKFRLNTVSEHYILNTFPLHCIHNMVSLSTLKQHGLWLFKELFESS